MQKWSSALDNGDWKSWGSYDRKRHAWYLCCNWTWSLSKIDALVQKRSLIKGKTCWFCWGKSKLQDSIWWLEEKSSSQCCCCLSSALSHKENTLCFDNHIPHKPAILQYNHSDVNVSFHALLRDARGIMGTGYDKQAAHSKWSIFLYCLFIPRTFLYRIITRIVGNTRMGSDWICDFHYSLQYRYYVVPNNEVFEIVVL